MPADIEDVAEYAGVSTATVSRALRGLPNVSAATRQKVLLAAEALDYSMSPSASRLATGTTRSIAVVAPYLGRCLAPNTSALTTRSALRWQPIT